MCLKLFKNHSRYMRQLQRSQVAFAKRKWLEAWKAKFMNKSRYNYLCEVQRSLTKARPTTVTFDLKQQRRKNVSATRAASPVDCLENRAPIQRSTSKSPTKSPGGILRKETVFRNLTNDFI